MTLPAVREGLKNALETIPGLRAFDTMPQAIPETPVAYVLPVTGNYHYTMDDNLRYDFDITVAVSLKPSFSQAQELLDEFISPTGDRSIMKAIEADPTLDGACDMVKCDAFTDYGFVIYGGIQYLGVRFRVEIYE